MSLHLHHVEHLAIPTPPPRPPPLNPAAAAYDSVARTYDGTYQSDRCRVEDEQLTMLLNPMLDQLSMVDGRVLDVGCGTGHFLKLTHWPQLNYTGIDVSSAMLDQARVRYPDGRLLLASVEDMPLVDNSFDAAVSLFSALSYVAAPVRALTEIRRVLRRDAPAFLMVCAPRWYHRNSSVLADVHVHASVAAWTPWQARARMEEAGFVHIRVTGFSLLPTWLIPHEGWLARRYPERGRYLIMEGRA